MIFNRFATRITHDPRFVWSLPAGLTNHTLNAPRANLHSCLAGEIALP
jgi:hypothetical protein